MAQAPFICAEIPARSGAGSPAVLHLLDASRAERESNAAVPPGADGTAAFGKYLAAVRNFAKKALQDYRHVLGQPW